MFKQATVSIAVIFAILATLSTTAEAQNRNQQFRSQVERQLKKQVQTKQGRKWNNNKNRNRNNKNWNKNKNKNKNKNNKNRQNRGQRGNNGNKQNSGNNRNSKANMPQTSGLDRELQQTGQKINSLANRVSNVEKSVESARKSAEDVAQMIKTLGKLDDKVSRIKRQLDSLSRIPQLRLLRPLVSNLERVRQQLHSIRVKADQVNRDTVQPTISRLKQAEREIELKVREIRQVAGQTQRARQKLSQLRNFVENNGNRFGEIRAVESLARPVRQTIRPMNQAVSRFENSLGNVDRDFKVLAQKLRAATTAKNSLRTVDRDLAGADSAARELNKVLSQRISVTFPVSVSVSVRELLEAPGQVIDIVLKPLEALARQALDPVLRKLGIEVRMPPELASIPNQLNTLKSTTANVQNSISKLESRLQRQLPQRFSKELARLMQKSTSQLTR